MTVGPVNIFPYEALAKERLPGWIWLHRRRCYGWDHPTKLMAQRTPAAGYRARC